MNNPILSQDEIDALLHVSKEESSGDEFLSVLNLTARRMESWLGKSTADLVEIKGPYVERIGPDLGQSVREDVLVCAADVAEQELFLIMTAADADFLGAKLHRTPLEAAQLLSGAWAEEMAAVLGLGLRLFAGHRLRLPELARLPVQAESVLARHLIQMEESSLEFCLLFQGDKHWKKEAPGPGSLPGMRGKSGGRKLLRGDPSPVSKAVFSPLDLTFQEDDPQAISLLEDIDLLVTVELGQATLTLKELLELKPQSLIKLDSHAGEMVDVYVNYNKAARGEVVVLDDNFGVRILEIVPKSERAGGKRG